MKTPPCPQCGEPADLSKQNTYRPFCSKRCKLIDLGDWINENNTIPDSPDTGHAWQNDEGNHS